MQLVVGAGIFGVTAALAKWRESELFHETGVMYLSRGPMKPV